MFEIIICDDDSACLEQTNQLVNDWIETASVPVTVKTIDNGDMLLNYCNKYNPDMILLDIMMPLLNGMDAAREIREHNLTSKIIFLTSSPEFAIESYDVDASGYLLKPIDRNKLYKLLNKCLSEISRPADSITIHSAFGYQNIYLHNIEYLEAQNKKVIISLSNGDKTEAIGALSYYEKSLTLEKGFFKCHRSYIVYIPTVDHFSGTELVTKSGTRIPIARGLGRTFQDTYFSYMFRE